MTLSKSSPRAKQRWGLLAFAVIALTLLATASLAFNAPLSTFEIDGDPSAGQQVGGGGGATVDGVDWARIAAGVGGTEALVYNAANPVVSNVNPSDNPAEPGTATFFRDNLKVDPDATTFTNGNKEDDCVEVSNGVCQTSLVAGRLTSVTPWDIVSGSVPPNKDDLFDIYTYARINGSNADVVLGAIRTNNLGDSHIDYELNKLPWEPCVDNAATLCPRRSEGDILISYEISNTTPTAVHIYRWDLPGGLNGECAGNLSGPNPTQPCPWEEFSFPASAIVSTLNSAGAIAAPPWGSRTPNGVATNTIPQFGFFETFLDFDQLGLGPSCPGFATASAKARSSTSVTSALHDLAGPFPINLNTCGKITIIKDTVPNAAQDFNYTTSSDSPAPALSPAAFDLDDDANNTLSDRQVYNNVTPGTYHVVEAPETGYVLTSLTCQVTGAGSSGAQDAIDPTKANITVANLGEVTCTYVNTLQQGAIRILKSDGKGGALAGATFSIKLDDGDGVFEGDAIDVPITGSPFLTNATGICVNTLSFADYWVTETAAPTGYQIDDTTNHKVTVDNNATCADATYVGESISFTDTPLSDIGVTFNSQAGAGVTRASIVCAVTGGSTLNAVSENGGVDSVALTANTAANPSVVTTASPHGLVTGAKVLISGSNSSPSINGISTVTVLSATTFSIPKDLSAGTAGTAGTVSAMDDTNESFTNLVPGSYTCTVFVDP